MNLVNFGCIRSAIFLAFPLCLGAAPGDLKWTFATGGAVRSSPALSTNGYVYFCSTDGNVYAVEAASGIKRWHVVVSSTGSSPAIASDGTVFVGTTSGAVLALDGTTGRQRWSVFASDQVLSSPALAANGSLYAASMNGTLVAMNSVTGELQWEQQLDGARIVYGSPSIGAGGVVFCTAGGNPWQLQPPGQCYALDGLTGRVLWTFGSVNFIQASPAIGADGTVYIPSYDKLVYALDPLTGAKKWAHLTGDSISSSPGIGPDGTLYVGCNDGRLYALDGATGTEKWTFLTADTIHSSPAIAADDTVYFGSYDKTVYALNGRTGVEKWRFITGGQVLSSPVIGPDGTVFIGSHDGHLYAFEGSAAPASGPWAAFKGGPQRTSSSERDGPPVFIQPPENVLIAEGSSTFLDAVVQGTRPMYFQWFRSGELVTNGITARLEILAARLSDTDQYTLIASNALGVARVSARLNVGFVLTLMTPPLNSRPSGNQLILSFPTNAIGFTLQSTPDLNPPVTWTDSPISPTVIDGSFTITNTLSGAAQFYRLRK